MAGTNRRRLSAEERVLWGQAMAGTAPLHRETQRPPELPEAPKKTPVSGAGGLTIPPRRRGDPGGVSIDLAPGLHTALTQRPPRMDSGRLSKLRRGRLAPEARLDLHGMTAERAHSALTRFILSSQADGLRLVLIITGKGRTDEAAIAPQRQGVLRHSVPQWLSTPPLAPWVLEILPAHRRHGGEGAYYVYLRRQR